MCYNSKQFEICELLPTQNAVFHAWQAVRFGLVSIWCETDAWSNVVVKYSVYFGATILIPLQCYCSFFTVSGQEYMRTRRQKKSRRRILKCWCLAKSFYVLSMKYSYLFLTAMKAERSSAFWFDFKWIQMNDWLIDWLIGCDTDYYCSDVIKHHSAIFSSTS